MPVQRVLHFKSALAVLTALALAAPAARGDSLWAVGGTVTNYLCDGTNWTAHIFTNVGATNLMFMAGGINIEALAVGGGGGGGETIGGGGGGGGVIYTNAFIDVTGEYTVIVGDGGAGGWGTGYPAGVKGSNSVFGSLTAIGGGAGAGYNVAASGTGGSAGGNGGGGGARAGYTPGQGNDGGAGWNNNAGGGGGGAGQAGTNASSGSGGQGGDGRAFDISGVSNYYGGGGGGGTRNTTGPNPGAGGAGGGGAGGRTAAGTNGLPNTGGGGGGGGFVADLAGGKGGSGIVIVRYSYNPDLPIIETRPVSDVTDVAASFNGYLWATGSAPTKVFLFWGETDGSNNPAAWTHTNEFAGFQEAGPLTTNIAGLTPHTVYFYRYYATNDNDESWASASAELTTLDVPAVNNASGADPVWKTWATLRGNLTDGTRAHVTVYWGTDTNNWAHTNCLGELVEGAFSTNATGLDPGTTYYYRCYASNNIGTAWASAPTPFTTLAAGTYVTPTGAGAFNGNGWENAFDSLQDALDAMTQDATHRVVYLKHGTYENDYATCISALHSGAAVKGGYAGNDTGGLPGELSDSASILAKSGSAEESIIIMTNCVPLTLERLTVQDGIGAFDGKGGGLYVVNSTLTVTNCTIRDHYIYREWDTVYGGGVYASGSTLVFADSLFIGNVIYGKYQANAKIGKAYGGAIYSTSTAKFTARNCRFFGNRCSADTDGHTGAIFIGNGSGHLLENCLFANNFGQHNAQTLCLSASTTVRNCTVAESLGGTAAIYVGAVTVPFVNCIFWNNINDVATNASAIVTYNRCCSAYALAGTNIVGDPLFTRGFYLSQTNAGQTAQSPCVDAGVANTNLAGLTTRTDGGADEGLDDIGFHYTGGLTEVDIYVSASGGDDTNGLGTADSPYKTITKALSVAQEHSARILAATGLYNSANGETFPLSMKSGVELIGAGNSATGTVIDAGAVDIRNMNVYYCRRGTRIENVRIQNGSGDIRYGGGLYIIGSMLDIVNCDIRNNNLDQSIHYNTQIGGGIYVAYSQLTVENSVFRSNSTYGSHANSKPSAYGGGIYCSTATLVLRNNRFLWNAATGYTDGDGGGLYLGGGWRNKIENCVFARNSANKGGSGLFLSASLTILNCSIVSNRTAPEGVWVNAGTVNFNNSIIWTNANSEVAGGGYKNFNYCCVDGGTGTNIAVGCITNDPLFVGGEYYHVSSPMGRWDPTAAGGAGGWVRTDTEFSPCIDAGDPASMNYIAEPHPHGFRVNMGAYGGTVHASKSRPPLHRLLFKLK